MEEVTKLLDKFWFKSKDCCDNPNDSNAQKLQAEVRQIHGEARAEKSPDYLFERIKELERMVQSLKNNVGIYSPGDVDDMYDRCQDLKQKLRELSR